MFESEADAIRIKKLAEDIVLTEDQIKELKQDVLINKHELIFLMQSAGQTAVKLDSGLAPRLETQQRISKRKEVGPDDLFFWLSVNELEDIIKPTVHPKTLQSTLEEFIARGGELPPDLFSQFEQTVVRFGGRTEFVRNNNSVGTAHPTGE